MPLIKNPADPHSFAQKISRRAFIGQSACGLGGLALGLLLGGGAEAARGAREAGPEERWRGIIRTPQFPVRAKRVIHLCMAGGPSQFETFDNKPALRELHGKPFPASLTKGQQLAQLQGAELKAFAPQAEFKKWGKSGQEIST